MKITQIVQETTTSGSVATVSQPIGNMQKRISNKKAGSMFAGKTTNKPFYEAEISEQDLILVPGQGRRMKPGFISKAADRTDREVEMALGDLFQAAKNAKMTYDMLKDISEDEGIEGWVQEKIIKASDYLNTIREYLENKRLQSEGTMGAIAGGVAGAYLGKSPSAAITGAKIGSELQDTFTTEGKEELHAKLKEINHKIKMMRGGPVDQPNNMAFVEKRQALMKQKKEIEAQLKQGVAEGERTMSRAAKGYEKYGKQGMQALAKAGREGKDLDKIRDKYNKYDEGVMEDSGGQVVFLGTGANGGKYEIIQTGPTDFMIHINGKHIDTYSSLQRAMGVLKNEVPGLKQGMGEGAKVDRMVKHVEKSEEKAGKSKKEAENIAWATANKRGMLNNKNKK